jgi:2-methylisocitrate lyase-like PEP mutase family enzyme
MTVPVNADFQGGFADDPQQVSANVELAVATGIAGLSIEDSTGDDAEPLYEFDLAVERVQAARQAIDESGTGVVLTGRSEGFVCGRPDIDETIRRLRAYADAGADCLYAPRIDNVEYVAAIVSAVSPKPVNLLINAPFITVTEAANLGVRRISVGGTLARAAWRGFLEAANEIADEGTFSRSNSCRTSKRCSAINSQGFSAPPVGLALTCSPASMGVNTERSRTLLSPRSLTCSHKCSRNIGGPAARVQR